MYNDGVKLIEARGEGDSPRISLRFDKQLRQVISLLICLSFFRELRRIIIALICLINDRGDISTFLGVRSEFNTHNPAICQAYFLPLPKQNLTIGKLRYLTVLCL